MQVGEQWGHRPTTQTRQLQRAEIIEVIPRPKKDRYMIRLDDGRERAVSGSTLVCAWEDADAWHAQKAMEDLVNRQGGERDGAEAVRRIFQLIPEDVAELRSGRVLIRDEGRLETRLGVRAEDLYAECGRLPQEEGGVLTSALAAERIAVALCRRYPASALSSVPPMVDPPPYEREERRWGRGDARDVIRRWCGLDAVEAFEGRGALASELVRLARLVDQLGEAVAALGASGDRDRPDLQLVDVGLG